MPTIRFVRENKDVSCQSGENLREIILKEGLELYGLKGKLGNCGGRGQCATCLISVEGGKKDALSPFTDVEKNKLKGKAANWRLACQSLVRSSVLVMTRPQNQPPDAKTLIKSALTERLPN